MRRIISTAIILLAICTLSFSQAPVNGEKESAFGPKIEFEMLSHNFGVIPQNGDGKVDFVFTNTGTEPLMLTNVRSSCGCTVPEWPREPIAAGAKSVIKVNYDTRRVGAFKKSISVYSNVSEVPIRLEISGTVDAPAAATD
ncbi:MAG: DUF1573 domain-containing protein [Bacteroidales bacterium]|nr:DUF1573 domain-containing protein [Bacteroidales bacterium]